MKANGQPKQNDANAGGSIVSLWRYPVKSMMGEEINSSLVTERGLLGDRSYALVDLATGKVVSAKNPRKWPQCSASARRTSNLPTCTKVFRRYESRCPTPDPQPVHRQIPP